LTAWFALLGKFALEAKQQRDRLIASIHIQDIPLLACFDRQLGAFATA
jgi:hypothetical protein